MNHKNIPKLEKKNDQFEVERDRVSAWMSKRVGDYCFLPFQRFSFVAECRVFELEFKKANRIIVYGVWWLFEVCSYRRYCWFLSFFSRSLSVPFDYRARTQCTDILHTLYRLPCIFFFFHRRMLRSVDRFTRLCGRACLPYIARIQLVHVAVVVTCMHDYISIVLFILFVYLFALLLFMWAFFVFHIVAHTVVTAW